MGILIVSIGSAATAVIIISAIYVIFFNPRATFTDVARKTISLHKQLPILAVFPIFVFSLFIFSVGRSNFSELLETLASHFQLMLVVPTAVGVHFIGKTENFTDLFLQGLRIGILIVLPISILQITMFEMRPEGVSGNSLIFSFILVLAGALCLLKNESMKGQSRLIYYAAPICAIFMIVISFSRAPILIAIVLFGISMTYVLKRQTDLKTVFYVAVSAIFILFISLSYIFTTDFGAKYFEKRILSPIESIANGEIKDNSLQKRLDLQITGFHAFLKKPYLGYGLPNTVEGANSVSYEVLDRQTEYTFSHMHNDYLTYALAGGIFTFLQFIIILLSPIIINHKTSFQNTTPFMWWFSLLVSLGFAFIATTNVLLGHDITSTFFSMCLLLIVLNNISSQESKNNLRTN